MRNFDESMGSFAVKQRFPFGAGERAPAGRDNLFSVPNLTWRRKGRILINPLSYVASEKELNGLSFTNFPLLKNHPTYIRYIGQPFYVKGVSKEKNFWMYSLKSPIYHLTVGEDVLFNAPGVGGAFLSGEHHGQK